MKRRSKAGKQPTKARPSKTVALKRGNAPKPAGPRASAAGPKGASDARRLGQSLRESEERSALVSQAVAEGIYDWNIELNSLFVSSRLMEIFSFEGPGLTSEDWNRRVHPDDTESYRKALRDCFKRRALKLECQYRIRAADGNYRWVEDHGLPIRNKVGRAIRLVGAVSDITRRHQTEQALRDRDQELDAVLDTIDYGIVFMGPDLRAKIINRAFRQMWGISDEFIRMKRPTMSDLIYYNRYNNLYDVPSADFDNYVTRRVETVRTGTTLMSEMRRLDGRIIKYQALPLPDGGRMLTYFDITDVKLSEERARTARDAAEAALTDLRNAQDRLVQTEKLASLGQLTAGIAHEIKNPLNFVNNFSAVSVELIDELREALGGAHLDSKLRTEINEIADTLQGNLDKVVQHGKRADAIVKNMLLHSRQGAGEHRSADINALVEESLNLAYHGARAEKQCFNITLERSFDPAAGEADLFPQEVTRVLLNLISNGFYAATKRKAEADGGDYEPTLAAATKNLGNSVEIRIRDNGTGIPPDVKEKLFNPFFTTKPAGEGTGLGLSISHDIIVKQHGGSIEVDTKPGEFTEFRIVLPRAGVSPIKSGERG